ncbi:MAG: Uma2 family endonuclease, partial [Acaryochloridaceae cyanobacterium CSU_3_4]|nr:Uma2 family endonuclease [Acaryochloridaceae cyanobacterium CSU_3_4]
AGFRLLGGVYVAIPPTDGGRLPSEQLGLELGIHEDQLRWFTESGELIPLPEEAECQRAEQEHQRAEQAEQQLQQVQEQQQALLEKLRSLSPAQRQALGLDGPQ